MSKDINKRRIFDTAIQIVENEGYNSLTMRHLASNLNIKAASLYNHISNMEEIKKEISKYAIKKLYNDQINSIEGKEIKQDLINISLAYAKFYKENKDLYKIILELGTEVDEELIQYGAYIAEPFHKVLSMYDIDKNLIINYQRSIRSLIHGFIDMQEKGFFSHIENTSSAEDSFLFAINLLIQSIDSQYSKKIQIV